jgi:hypothetical protein
METISIYVLLEIRKAPKSETETAVGVTTDLDEANVHKARTPIPSNGGYKEYGYREFRMQTDLFVMGAENTQYLNAVKRFETLVAGSRHE